VKSISGKSVETDGITPFFNGLYLHMLVYQLQKIDSSNYLKPTGYPASLQGNMVQYLYPAIKAKLTAYGPKLSVLRERDFLYKTGLKGLIFLFFLHFVSLLHAQQQTGYVVHANIIYRFTKYIDWPPSSKSGDFNIGVVGDSPVFHELNKSIAGKWVGNQKINIKKISASAPAFDCQILYISDDAVKSIKKIAGKTANTPVLLVSETEGMAEKGSCINFVIVADRLKLEINPSNIEQRELGIASELLQLGKIVK
jgi:hypothetical protein